MNVYLFQHPPPVHLFNFKVNEYKINQVRIQNTYSKSVIKRSLNFLQENRRNMFEISY